MSNNFVAWKHGHVVAAVFLCAQLCRVVQTFNFYLIYVIYFKLLVTSQ